MEKLILHTETGKENGIPRFIASYPIEGFLKFMSQQIEGLDMRKVEEEAIPRLQFWNVDGL